MKKNLPKIITVTFLTIFIAQMIGLIVLVLLPLAGQAAESTIKFNNIIAIPGSDTFKGALSTEVTGTTLGQYIVDIYKYAIGIVGILAAIVLMYGGVVWITAFGSGDRISEAQSWIKASLTGLVLALSSFMILNMVNPDLTSFKPINLDTPGCCEEADGTKNAGTKNTCKGTFTEGECTTNTTTTTSCSANSSGSCKTSCAEGEVSFSNYSCDKTNEICCVPQNVGCGSVPGKNTICRNVSSGCNTAYGEEVFLADCGPSETCCKIDSSYSGCGNGNGVCMPCGSAFTITSCTLTYCPTGYSGTNSGTTCGENQICCVPQ